MRDLQQLYGVRHEVVDKVPDLSEPRALACQWWLGDVSTHRPSWHRFSGFLVKAECLQHPREAACLEAPLAQVFRPAHIKVRDANGKLLMDYEKGAFADTPEETRRGLEGRTFLRAGEALLLRYPQNSEHGDGRVGDVMQNTPQDLDIGWFDSSGKLLEIAPLRKNDSKVTWSKSSGIAYGLEVPRGSFASNGRGSHTCRKCIAPTNLEQLQDLVLADVGIGPGCLANDVALAAISDRIAYYAVPSSQVPGFVQHTNRGSVRTELNHRGL
eukprot:s356_g6.t1